MDSVNSTQQPNLPKSSARRTKGKGTITTQFGEAHQQRNWTKCSKDPARGGGGLVWADDQLSEAQNFGGIFGGAPISNGTKNKNNEQSTTNFWGIHNSHADTLQQTFDAQGTNALRVSPGPTGGPINPGRSNKFHRRKDRFRLITLHVWRPEERGGS